MKNVLMSLFLMAVFFTASAAGPIGSLGGVNTITVGGFVFNAADPNFIVLSGQTSNGTGYATLRAAGSSSGYVVPAGKTFYAQAIWFSTSQTNGQISLGYGTNDVGFASGTAPTGLTIQNGAPNNGGQPMYYILPGTASLAQQLPGMGFTVPAGDYPCFLSLNNGQVSLAVYGYVQ